MLARREIRRWARNERDDQLTMRLVFIKVRLRHRMINRGPLCDSTVELQYECAATGKDPRLCQPPKCSTVPNGWLLQCRERGDGFEVFFTAFSILENDVVCSGATIHHAWFFIFKSFKVCQFCCLFIIVHTYCFSSISSLEGHEKKVQPWVFFVSVCSGGEVELREHQHAATGFHGASSLHQFKQG